MKRLLLFAFFYSYILYPSYYVQGGELKKVLLLVLYIFLFGILRRVVPDRIKPPEETFYFPPFLIIPLFSALLFHLYFWSLPIPTLEDMQVYCGVPALFLSKIYSFLPRWILVLSALLFLTLLLIYLSGRGRRIWWCFFVLGILSALFIIHSICLESFGKLEHIFRHPPIPKTTYLLGYLFFGIEEWVGRFIQFIFLVAAGVFVGRITSLLTKEKGKFSFISGFTITLFFPTFFHWTNFCSLIGGELFFLSSSFYYFLRYIQDKEEGSLLYCMGILGLGLLYERRLAFLFLFIVLSLCLKIKPFISLLRYFLIPIIMAIPFIFVSYAYRDAALTFSWINQPSLLLLGVKQIYRSLGPIITLSTLLLLLVFLKKRVTLLFLVFFLSYYLFISSTVAVWCLRHAQPYYLSLAILFSLLIAKTRPSVLFCFVLIMLYQSILSSSPDLLTLSNYKMRDWKYREFGILPYRDAIAYIKKELPNTKVYAPMGCEPSHFYLAKFGIPERLWIRKPFLKGFSLSSLTKFCKENEIRYIVLPGYNPLFKEWIDLKLVSSIYRQKDNFRIKKRFFFGENELFLFEVK